MLALFISLCAFGSHSVFSKPVEVINFDHICEAALAIKSRISTNDTFQMNRSFSDYEDAFGTPLMSRLRLLGPESLIVDFGDGTGAARLGYLTNQWLPLPRAQTLGIDAGTVDKRPAPQHLLDILVAMPEVALPGHRPTHLFQSLRGHFFEDIPDREINITGTNRTTNFIDIALDYYGVLSYTHDLSGALSRIVGFLKIGTGALFLRTHSGSGDATGPSYNGTYIITRDGRHLNIGEWLHSIVGLEVEDIFHPRMRGVPYAYRISSGTAEVKIPALRITQIRTNGSPPPERTFREVAL